MVCINEGLKVKAIDNNYSDLNYSSDDASAMMVHAPSSNQVNGITDIEALTKDGSRFGTTILNDNGCTRYAIMSHNFLEILGYEFEPISYQSYVTAMGQMNTKFQMTVNGIRLPHLSRHRTFSATFEIAPKESGDFGFGVSMGINMMDDLGINTSRTKKRIMWDNNIKAPMVSKSHWTEACIQALCGAYWRHPSEILTNDKFTSEPSTLAHKESSLILVSSKPAQPASSFTKAVYEKPDSSK